MPIDNGIIQRFRRQLSTGSVVLFTGAGFSHDAIAVSGNPVIGVADLKRELARLAFPSDADAAAESTLPDLFDVAVSRAEGRVRRLFEERLRVDRARTPERFDKWFGMPWKRHYTLNIDDLDEVVMGRASLPRSITSISASNHLAVQTPDLLSVHLNGRLTDFPHVTFSVRQYARRAGMPDPWYELLTTDLLSNPVLFVGTGLEEPGLWQHIEMRSVRNQGDVELRPPSYLVSPALAPARAALLRRFNVDWVQATEQEFFDAVLGASASEREQGHQAIRRQHHPATATGSFRPVSQLRTASDDGDLGLYLLGRDPIWADVQEDGFAVTREFEKDLRVRVDGGERLVLLTGTAASGKTTTAMRLALSLEADGKKTFAYDAVDGSLSANHVLDAARRLRPEVMLIDDVDVFGEAAGRLLADLSHIRGIELVVATIRNSRMHSLGIEENLEGVDWFEQTIPPLGDGDIDLLIESLGRAGLLGRMTGMRAEARRKLFAEQAGRQLLVAMYFATSGEQLEDRVRSECEDLGGVARMAYGMAALATSDHQAVQKAELLIGLGVLGYGADGNQTLNQVQQLVERNLLVEGPRGLQVRHRWIAEKSVDFFVSNGLIHKVILALAFALASEVDPQASPHGRERRMLRRLINHDRMKRLVADVDACREIFSRLQDRLAWDYHYWLQRGSLEVECGDLNQAMTYIEAARSLVEGVDYIVETEYAYVLLKRASENPNSAEASSDASIAFADLEEIMRSRGRKDSYPYHVYGSQGLRWARRAPLSSEQRKVLVGQLLEAVRSGRKFHPKQRDLRQLEEDLHREYLLQATGQ